VAKWLGGYCMAENSSSPNYTNAILPLNRLTTTNHHYHHYSHMTILAIKTSRLAEWTFSRQTANTANWLTTFFPQKPGEKNGYNPGEKKWLRKWLLLRIELNKYG
jgi:hypothetical protein